MKIKVVIMHHNRPENADKLYDQLRCVFDVEVFDSGSDPDKIPKNVTESFENIYWTGIWNEVLVRYKEDHDVLWVLGCDIELRSNNPREYLTAIETAMPFGCWSPGIEGRCHDFMNASHYDMRAVSVKNIEGMAMAISGDLARKVGKLYGSKIGFGQDFWMCHLARKEGMRNKIDGRVCVHHPEGIGYNEQIALQMMDETFGSVFGEDYRQSIFEYSWDYHGNCV